MQQVTLVAALVALSLAACGGAGPGSHAAAGAPPAHAEQVVGCAVLTAADAEPFLGGPVEQDATRPPVPPDADYATSCGYTTTDMPFGEVDTLIFHHRSVQAARSSFDLTRNLQLAKGGQDLTGIGDAAFAGNLLGPEIWVLRGQFTLTVGTNRRGTMDALRPLAAKVAGRIR